MMKIKIITIVILISALFISFSDVDEQVDNILKKVSSSYEKFSFIKKQTETYYRDGEIVSEFTYERYNDHKNANLLKIGTKKGEDRTRKSLRTKNYVISQREEKFIKMERPHFTGSAFLNKELLELMKENYMFKACKGTDIIGRKTNKLTIKSDVNYKPWTKIWVDVETGLILQKEAYDSSNELVYSYTVDFLELNPVFDKDIFYIPENKIEESSRKRVYFNTIEDLKKKSNKHVASLTGILKEFKPMTIRTFSRQGQEIIHIWYTDGYSTISIFQRKANEKDKQIDLQVDTRITATSLRKVQNGCRFTMIGDLSEAVLVKAFNNMLNQFERESNQGLE
ncbi:sigma-E factor regulatory protein RseB domain-containing protein [candidate division KSB1 bacterium]